jgi:hypothetical protein
MKLKRLIVSAGTRYCLTKDDVDLRVTIYLTYEKTGLEPELTFSIDWRCFVLLPLLQLLNSKVISLPMNCFHCKLTSLISQALLQVALDKEASHWSSYSANHEF